MTDVHRSVQVIELCPYRVGDRVRLREGIDGPQAREGTVVETFGMKGVRVFHDEPACWKTAFGQWVKQDFNWILSEVERV